MYIYNSTSKRKDSYYQKHPKDGDCQFCKMPDNKVIKQIGKFIVIRNMFGYDIFDMCEVTDHLMIIPVNHIDNLTTLSKQERLDFLDIMDDYEKAGYNVFFREPQSAIRTVDHHHTHLLKLGKEINHLTFTREPYSMDYS